MISVDRLRAEDRAAWGRLAAGYKAFYNTPTSEAEYDEAWRRLQADDGVHAFGARLDGQLVGIVHYLFHTSTWARDNLYLQDLFTDPAVRGRGVARTRQVARMYWLTQETNRTARTLYDKVAVFKGFIRYDYPMP